MAVSGAQLRARGEDLVVVVATGLFAAGLCFVRPTVFESADYVVYWRPTFQFLADTVRAGVVPLWNPYIGLGRPFLADMQNAVLYPPTYLICLGQGMGVFLLMWLHGLLAVLGMRRLGGALGTGRWQSYLMGFTFLASGPLTARCMTGQISYCWGLSFVPWLLYYAARTEEVWQRKRLAQYAVCLALQFLCGHPQVFWISAIGQGVFIIGRAVRLPLRQAIRDAGRGLCQFGAACAWCAGLVAAALLPMLELAEQSNRSASSPGFANAFNLAWSDLGYLFSPLQSAGARWETNLFAGTLVAVLGLAGLCRVRERNVRGLLGMGVMGLLIALGDRTPLFGVFYHWLPSHAGFRFHSRASVLLVVAVICAAGIWLSRPHPHLRAAWSYLFGVPVRYAILLLVLAQSLELLQGAWMIKGVVTYVCSYAAGVPLDRSFEQAVVAELRQADLIKAHRPPPRVCVPPSLVPVNCGMVHGYSHFDAACSLFVRGPWDYLHAVLGVPPAVDRSFLSPQVYRHGPFPYRDLSLSLGVETRTGRLVRAGEPSPRAWVVYGVEVTDYRGALDQLARGYDVRQRALLGESPAKPLPRENALLGTPASIRRFERNSLEVEVEARTNGLLVLAEAWYPGWRAEIKGRAVACVPANIWMRAVPVPAGRHVVRLYFRQNYLAAGLVISLASIGLVLVATTRPRGRIASPLARHDAVNAPAASCAGPGGAGEELSQGPTAQPGALSAYRPPLRVLAAGVVVALIWLAAKADVARVRRYQTMRSEVQALVHCRVGEVLALQHETAQAAAHYAEAVRLAERACELTAYGKPMVLGTLAYAYGEAGRLDEALAAARKGQELALASGEKELAERLSGLLQHYNARRQGWEGQRD